MINVCQMFLISAILNIKYGLCDDLLFRWTLRQTHKTHLKECDKTYFLVL